MAMRKAKRAPLTQTALDGIQREAAKAGMGLHDALAMCCARGWQGFKADWVAGQKPGVVVPQSKAARQAADQEWVDELIGRTTSNVIDITPESCSSAGLFYGERVGAVGAVVDAELKGGGNV
jgi:hypothetical protein